MEGRKIIPEASDINVIYEEGKQCVIASLNTSSSSDAVPNKSTSIVATNVDDQQNVHKQPFDNSLVDTIEVTSGNDNQHSNEERSFNLNGISIEQLESLIGDNSNDQDNQCLILHNANQSASSEVILYIIEPPAPGVAENVPSADETEVQSLSSVSNANSSDDKKAAVKQSSCINNEMTTIEQAVSSISANNISTADYETASIKQPVTPVSISNDSRSSSSYKNLVPTVKQPLPSVRSSKVNICDDQISTTKQPLQVINMVNVNTNDTNLTNEQSPTSVITPTVEIPTVIQPVTQTGNILQTGIHPAAVTNVASDNTSSTIIPTIIQTQVPNNVASKSRDKVNTLCSAQEKTQLTPGKRLPGEPERVSTVNMALRSYLKKKKPESAEICTEGFTRREKRKACSTIDSSSSKKTKKPLLSRKEIARKLTECVCQASLECFDFNDLIKLNGNLRFEIDDSEEMSVQIKTSLTRSTCIVPLQVNLNDNITSIRNECMSNSRTDGEHHKATTSYSMPESLPKKSVGSVEAKNNVIKKGNSYENVKFKLSDTASLVSQRTGQQKQTKSDLLKVNQNAQTDERSKRKTDTKEAAIASDEQGDSREPNLLLESPGKDARNEKSETLNKKTATAKNWTYDDVIDLLTSYKTEYRKVQEDFCSSRNFWQNILSRITRETFHHEKASCITKLHGLRAQYITRLKKRNKKDLERWPYAAAMRELIDLKQKYSKKDPLHKGDNAPEGRAPTRIMNGTYIAPKEKSSMYNEEHEKLLACKTSQLRIKKTAESHVCPLCNILFTDGNSLQAHLREHAMAPENFCSVCQKYLLSQEEFFQHLRTNHKETSNKLSNCSMSCLICHKTFKKRERLVRHFVTHKDTNDFQCDICGKFFKFKSYVRQHKQGLHAKEKPFKCQQCGLTFHFKPGYYRHILNHSGSRPFQCTYCTKTYTSAVMLKQHIQSKHDRINRFTCECCGRNFFSRVTFTRHYKRCTNNKPFLCTVCGKSFIENHALKKHTSLHDNTRSFPCDICGKDFKTEQWMKIHYRKHTGDFNKFFCDICGRGFMFRSKLLTHFKTHNKSL